MHWLLLYCIETLSGRTLSFPNHTPAFGLKSKLDVHVLDYSSVPETFYKIRTLDWGQRQSPGFRAFTGLELANKARF